ncbi:hypothetical protein CI109_106842 [Kwoniella shandongensis]|uniref:Uncharacterized protein n=1 Tax=Kwoniella shandongensis TaxID=1734106 RepID=A0A5M6CAD0_9TREE|nr:uncharacterized protein CI109_000902 [Kwoniella shandongensis]KAA5530722.1 hypothetical protein CI109_000902 [Kwoniella shandongensis]
MRPHSSTRSPIPPSALLLAMSILLSAPKAVRAQTQPISGVADLSGTTTSTSSPTAVASPAGSTSNSTSCAYDGSVGDYISCQRQRVSTPVLIGAGIGVVIGILILSFGCIWLAKRPKRRQAVKDDEVYQVDLGAKESDKVQVETAERLRKRDRFHEISSISSGEEISDRPLIRHREDDRGGPPLPSRDPQLPPAPPYSVAVRANKSLPPVNSVTMSRRPSKETIHSQKSSRPPPPGSSSAPRPSTVADTGTPIQPNQPRNLYLSNPSPISRHLPAQPQSQSQLQSHPVGRTYQAQGQVQSLPTRQQSLRRPPSRTSIISTKSAKQSVDPHQSTRYGTQPPLPSLSHMRGPLHPLVNGRNGGPVPLRGASTMRPPGAGGAYQGGGRGLDVPPVPPLDRTARSRTPSPNRQKSALRPAQSNIKNLSHDPTVSRPIANGNVTVQEDQNPMVIENEHESQPTRRGTLPLNIRKPSSGQSTLIPPRPVTSSAPETSQHPVHPIGTNRASSLTLLQPKVLGTPPVRSTSTYDPPSGSSSNIARSEAPPVVSSFRERKIAEGGGGGESELEYMRLESASGSSGSERASSGSESLTMPLLPSTTDYDVEVLDSDGAGEGSPVDQKKAQSVGSGVKVEIKRRPSHGSGGMI